MKKILFSVLLSIMFMGVGVSNGMAQTLPDVEVTLAMNKTAFLLNDSTNQPEPLRIDITLENAGDDLTTVAGTRDKPIEFFLTFITPDGTGVKVKKGRDITEPVNPLVFFVDGELVQVDKTEIWTDDFLLTVSLDNAHLIYTTLAAHGAGEYSVKAIINFRTYPGTFVNTDLAALESANFQGLLVSNTVHFSLVADADGDGYSYPIAMSPPAADPTYAADCNDDDASVNPGIVADADNDGVEDEEYQNDGLDNDCNPATLDVYIVDPGTINVQVDKHTVGKGKKNSGSTKEPLMGVTVRAFDKFSCVSSLGVSGQNYELIWQFCEHAAIGATKADGTVSLSVSPGNYIVIGVYVSGIEGEPNIYTGVSAGGVASGETKDKYLQVIVDTDGNIVPAKFNK